MANDDITIGIKTEYDNSGAQEAQKHLAEVTDAATESQEEQNSVIGETAELAASLTDAVEEQTKAQDESAQSANTQAAAVNASGNAAKNNATATKTSSAATTADTATRKLNTQAANTQAAAIRTAGQAATSASKGFQLSGYGMLQMAQFADDAQYGLRGVMNNIPSLVMGLGGGMGLAGALSVAVLGFSKLYDWYTKDAQEAERKAKEHMEAAKAAVKEGKEALQELKVEAFTEQERRLTKEIAENRERETIAINESVSQQQRMLALLNQSLDLETQIQITNKEAEFYEKGDFSPQARRQLEMERLQLLQAAAAKKRANDEAAKEAAEQGAQEVATKATVAEWHARRRLQSFEDPHILSDKEREVAKGTSEQDTLLLDFLKKHRETLIDAGNIGYKQVDDNMLAHALEAIKKGQRSGNAMADRLVGLGHKEWVNQGGPDLNEITEAQRRLKMSDEAVAKKLGVELPKEEEHIIKLYAEFNKLLENIKTAHANAVTEMENARKASAKASAELKSTQTLNQLKEKADASQLALLTSKQADETTKEEKEKQRKDAIEAKQAEVDQAKEELQRQRKATKENEHILADRVHDPLRDDPQAGYDGHRLNVQQSDAFRTAGKQVAGQIERYLEDGHLSNEEMQLLTDATIDAIKNTRVAFSNEVASAQGMLRHNIDQILLLTAEVAESKNKEAALEARLKKLDTQLNELRNRPKYN